MKGDLLRDAQRRIADVTFEREHTLDLGGVTVDWPRSNGVAALARAVWLEAG